MLANLNLQACHSRWDINHTFSKNGLGALLYDAYFIPLYNAKSIIQESSKEPKHFRRPTIRCFLAQKYCDKSIV